MLARLKVRLTLEGPVLSRASAPAAPGIDSPVARGPRDCPILPFSLVQGNLRQAFEEIGAAIGADQRRIDELLGRASGDANGDWLPQPGRLFFSDFVAERGGGSQIDTSVRLDDARQAADEGALRHLELPFLAGESIDFLGEVRFFARSHEDAHRVADEVEKGLRWIPFYGSERTVGFGRAVAVATELLMQAISEPERAPAAGGDRLAISLRFEAPFCLAVRPEAGNLFEGGEVVPGSALKGTLARALQQLYGLGLGTEIGANLPAPFIELGYHFSRLRFTHAFPSLENGPRPAVVPKSTVAVREGERTGWYDVALCSGPVLIGEEAPAFAVDWKEGQLSEVRALLGGARAPDRELRLRTAISRRERRAADEQLFAYEAVCPSGLVWRAEVDLERVPEEDRVAVSGQLVALLGLGLQGVGKTAAEAKVEVDLKEPAEPAPVEALVDKSGKRVFVVTLQTAALLADPALLDEAAGDRRLYAAYAVAWRDLDGGLRLLRYFSEEKLAGGYLTERFRRARTTGERTYRPYLLTEPGSVFVLAAEDETRAGALLAGWARHGLPLPRWARDRYGDSYKTNPFTREDGFGEVVVNLAWHRDRQPQDFEDLPWEIPSAI